MKSILLHRINPEKNEFRYYLLTIGPSLPDKHAVSRLWGRIGGRQRGMVTPCVSSEEMDKLVSHLVRLRLRRGYKIVEGEQEVKG